MDLVRLALALAVGRVGPHMEKPQAQPVPDGGRCLDIRMAHIPGAEEEIGEDSHKGLMVLEDIHMAFPGEYPGVSPVEAYQGKTHPEIEVGEPFDPRRDYHLDPHNLALGYLRLQRGLQDYPEGQKD